MGTLAGISFFEQMDVVVKMRRVNFLCCWLLCGLLALPLYSCQKIANIDPVASASETSSPMTASQAEGIQPDPEHPITTKSDELFIANYDAARIAYNIVIESSPQLYLALASSNLFLHGLPNENIEGSAVLTEDSQLKIYFVVERPHEGGTVDGVRIGYFYDTVNDSVNDISVEKFLGSDGILYTIDYTEQNALEDGRLLGKIVGTFEEYMKANNVQ